jgi:hypothetical protein
MPSQMNSIRSASTNDKWYETEIAVYTKEEIKLQQ